MARAPVDLQGGDVLAVFSDGSPAVVTRRLGKGTTLYCNFSDRIDSSKGNRGLISEMIGFAGLTPAVAVSANGENLGGFQSFRYRRGPIELIGLLHTLSSSGPSALHSGSAKQDAPIPTTSFPAPTRDLETKFPLSLRIADAPRSSPVCPMPLRPWRSCARNRRIPAM